MGELEKLYDILEGHCALAWDREICTSNAPDCIWCLAKYLVSCGVKAPKEELSIMRDIEKDNELVSLEAMLLSMEGKDPSAAIENQERRGQQTVVRYQRLPKKTNWTRVPREIRTSGTSPRNGYERNYDIERKNIQDYTKDKYEELCIEILGEYDDLFFNVKLPDGWEIRATDHPMWNELVDARGEVRAEFFYKAAFYDRGAFINFKE